MTFNPLSQALPLHSLSISTNIRLHPDFSKAPVVFAQQSGVVLADDVFHETSFMKDAESEDPYNQEKTAKVKTNIHLVQHGAIRLFAERDDEGDWVVSINLNPSLLLHEAKRHPLLDSDLSLSLGILRNMVTPLLADPLDARHIVPGLVSEKEAIAYWSLIESEILIPGIRLPCLHRLSHPMTGSAEGATKTCIQLGNNGGDSVIRFESSQSGWPLVRRGSQTVQGVRVTLTLKGRALTAEFGQFGTTTLVNNIERLTAFPASAVASVHQTMMSRLGGDLPADPAGVGGQDARQAFHTREGHGFGVPPYLQNN